MTEERSDRGRTTIVIPCYNTERFIAEAIESALAQTSPAAEVIVVDDGSTDCSLDVIHAFSNITILTQPNGGVSAARNAGLARAKSEYVIFLDADDRLMPEAISLHIAALDRNPGAAMVYGSLRIIDPESRKLGDSVQTPAAYSWRDVLFGKTPSPTQAMFRRDSLHAIGVFDHTLAIAEDFPLFLRLSRDAPIICHGGMVAEYRKHPGQRTKRPAAHLEAMICAQRAFRATFDEPCRSVDSGRAHRKG